MKIKVAELQGRILDYAVALAKWPGGNTVDYKVMDGIVISLHHFGNIFTPSTDWAQAGPIIEQARISVGPGTGVWFASIGGRGDDMEGPTPLIAAMRAFVSCKGGDSKYCAEIENPELLK